MKAPMTLTEIYKAVLATVRMYATDDGYISIRRSEKVTNPVVVKNKRWVLPVPEQLSNDSDRMWEKRTAFHPLYENLARGESEVVAEYRKSANYHLNAIAGLVMVYLLELAVEKARHSSLNPDQTEYLSAVKDADEHLFNTFKSLLEEMDGDKCMVNIFIKRGGMIKGKKHSRVGVVFFPLYEELSKATDNIRGHKLRKKTKDKETLMNLLKYIFPKIDEPQAYDFGSDSMIAPTMDALMHAMYNVIAPLNDVIDVFGDQFGDSESLAIQADWIEAFDSLHQLKAEIFSVPQLAGNEGATARAEAQAAAEMAQTVPGATSSGLPPPIAPPGGSQLPPPVAAPAVAPGYVVPAASPSLPQPVAPNHQQQQSRSNTGRGLDFDELMRKNPALAGQASFAAPIPVGQAVRGAMANGGWGAPAQQNNGWGTVATGWGGGGRI